MICRVLTIWRFNVKIPWSCDSCRRMSGDGEVGLGGMVVMVGAADITAEAGMCELSRSMLGLDGSSEDRNKRNLVLIVILAPPPKQWLSIHILESTTKRCKSVKHWIFFHMLKMKLHLENFRCSLMSRLILAYLQWGLLICTVSNKKINQPVNK